MTLREFFQRLTHAEDVTDLIKAMPEEAIQRIVTGATMWKRDPWTNQTIFSTGSGFCGATILVEIIGCSSEGSLALLLDPIRPPILVSQLEVRFSNV